MNPQDSISVSKGCFVSRGLKKQKNARLSTRAYFGNDRSDMAEALLDNIYGSVKRIHTNAMERLFANLTSFIKDAHKQREDYCTDVPAAALITGINMTGHFDSVSQLYDTIKSNASPHVAVVHAKNSPDIKSVMKSIGLQLMCGHADKVLTDSMEWKSKENGMPSYMNSVMKTSSPVVINDINEWYTAEALRLDKRDEIVVVFKDTEFFPSSVLQDMITMMSGIVQKLPFVVIFCVAMPWTNVINRQLPYSAICNLNLTKFYAPPSSELLTVVIDDILLKNNHPFKLGGKTLQLLLDQFLCNDFSLQNFLQSLKFCILEHFCNEPSSILCTNDLITLEKQVQNLSVDDLHHIQALPSVQRHLQSVTKKKKDALIKSEKNFRKFIMDSMFSLHDFHSCYYFVLRSLFSLCKSLPSSELACSLRQLYCTSYIHNITETVDYKRAMVLLRSCSKKQITSRLDAMMKYLEPVEECLGSRTEKNMYLKNLMKLKSELRIYLAKLEEDDFLESYSVSDDAEEMQSQQPLETVKYAYQLRDELQSRFRKKQMKGMTGFQKFREEIIDHLDAFFKQALHCPNSFEMHEVFYFDSPSSVRSHVLATPRLSVQSALCTPQHILSHESLVASEEHIPQSTPDVCIAYKLHRECGRIINLYDWLEAFHLIVSSGPHNFEDSEITEETQARFTRAVSELQFIGLIKPTKRKTDHVERLTW